MRVCRTFSLFVASAIIMLHSMVVHSHETDLSVSEHITQHKEASSILDYIALGFHGEHLDQQLEEFSGGSVFSLDEQDFIQITPLLSAIFIVQTTSDRAKMFYSLKATLSNFYSTSIGLRGPPSL